MEMGTGDLVVVWGYVDMNCGMSMFMSVLPTQSETDLPGAWDSVALL